MVKHKNCIKTSYPWGGGYCVSFSSRIVNESDISIDFNSSSLKKEV